MVNVKPVKLGSNTRMSFSKIDEVLEMPNLIEVQKNSYKWFLQEGLKEVFKDVSGITDYTGNLVLDFVNYKLDDKPNYSVEECKERDATYAAALRVNARLLNKESGEIKESEVFMGDFPLMTDSGTFVINGAERVIVSQLVRSPGVYYKMEYDKTGKELFSSTVIPNRGAWLEYENDANDVFYVRIDKNRKLPVTVFIRALGLGTDSEILEYFGEDDRILATIEKDPCKNTEEALFEVYRKLRPSEPPTIESAQTHINGLFFDARRYDLSRVGRYKYNKKLNLAGRIAGQQLTQPIINPLTGELMAEAGEVVSFEKAQEIALDYDIIAEQEEKVDVIEELLKEDEEDESTLVSRPPVVCVMGHVDHGKTSLLDCIRKTHVTDREAGGITQHIGAYMVNVDGQKITFLDTPGHEAFTAMRMRGANATDIAILVVAADDGVMPQTVEAINHAKAAGVEIIVAINKIDKPSANIERVKQELSEYELIPEDWGGSTIFAPVSAHTGEGIDNLLEMILLTAEVGELKANPNRRARGLVIEAELDKGKGPVATILVQKGTLRVGDFIAAGASSGKVRAMIDDKGRKVKEAGPSTPVEILGLSDVPNAGEILVVTENDKEAKNFAATFVSENKNRLLEETKAKMSLDDLFSQIQAGNLKELPIIVKADVQGSVEAVKQSLVKLSNEEVVVKVIHGGVGSITESDVTLASASNAIIIGFNVRPDATAKSVAEQEGVDLRLYRVIYQAIEDVEAAMKGMLDPVFEEKVIGHAEVRQIFKASGVGNIAGSYVLDGIFQRNCKVRITREGEQIFEGALASLKRFKDDVKEVKAGYECGLVFEDFNDIKEEDKVEAYIMVEVPR